MLTTSGIRGLAASNERLRVVYEDRMKPVSTLGQIAQLMLVNQHQSPCTPTLPPRRCA